MLYVLPLPLPVRLAASSETNWKAKWDQRYVARRVTSTSTANESSLINTAIVDSSARGWYFRTDATVTNMDRVSAKIHVGTMTGQAQQSDTSCTLPLSDILPGLFGHIMGGFSHNLLGIGNFCDKDCKVVFTRQTVTIYNKNGKPLLGGW